VFCLIQYIKLCTTHRLCVIYEVFAHLFRTGCYIVEKHLSPFIEGQDPRNIELMWDQMYRASINYGRKGLPIQCISAIDLALWDLLGKLRNETRLCTSGW